MDTRVSARRQRRSCWAPSPNGPKAEDEAAAGLPRRLTLVGEVLQCEWASALAELGIQMTPVASSSAIDRAIAHLRSAASATDHHIP